LSPDEDYQDAGIVEFVENGEFGGMDVYRVGNASRCVIWNYDIFGFKSGRTRQLADQLAQKGSKSDSTLHWIHGFVQATRS